MISMIEARLLSIKHSVCYPPSQRIQRNSLRITVNNDIATESIHVWQPMTVSATGSTVPGVEVFERLRLLRYPYLKNTPNSDHGLSFSFPWQDRDSGGSGFWSELFSDHALSFLPRDQKPGVGVDERALKGMCSRRLSRFGWGMEQLLVWNWISFFRFQKLQTLGIATW